MVVSLLVYYETRVSAHQEFLACDLYAAFASGELIAF